MRYIILFHLLLYLSLTSCSQQQAEIVPMNEEEVIEQPVVKHYLALGDSYTIGEAVLENERWPVKLVKALKNIGVDLGDAEIIARTGWTTRNLLNALDESDLYESYSWVSLLIGVNNQYQGRSTEEYRTEFEELLNRAIRYAGGDKDRVFVVSIPDYAYTPFGKGNEQVSQEIDLFNDINKSITDRYEIKYINITDISRRGLEEPELVADDGLHPSGIMYSEWVERIVEQIDFK